MLKDWGVGPDQEIPSQFKCITVFWKHPKLSLLLPRNIMCQENGSYRNLTINMNMTSCILKWAEHTKHQHKPKIYITFKLYLSLDCRIAFLRGNCHRTSRNIEVKRDRHGSLRQRMHWRLPWVIRREIAAKRILHMGFGRFGTSFKDLV